MNVIRGLIAGATVWLLVITTFTLLIYVPVLKDSTLMQSLIVIGMMVVYSSIGAYLYYRRTFADHGLAVGFLASGMALLLDVLVTVPFFEIPNGGGYFQFFTSPLLWVLVAINVIVFYVFGKRRVAA